MSRALFFLLLSLLLPSLLTAQITIIEAPKRPRPRIVAVRQAPPVRTTGVVTAAPGGDFIWVKQHWVHVNGTWALSKGYWIRNPSLDTWEYGRWQRRAPHGEWVWVNGRWR